MPTLLQRLCEEFATRVRPLIAPLDKAAATLDAVECERVDARTLIGR